MARTAPGTAGFAETFAALKAILARHAAELVVAVDQADHYCLNTTKEYRKRPMMFGAAKIGKQYVSYHLMPVYACPELLKGMSQELRKRMQGKSCFNFRAVDPGLFAELDTLTGTGLERFKRGGWA